MPWPRGHHIVVAIDKWILTVRHWVKLGWFWLLNEGLYFGVSWYTILINARCESVVVILRFYNLDNILIIWADPLVFNAQGKIRVLCSMFVSYNIQKTYIFFIKQKCTNILQLNKINTNKNKNLKKIIWNDDFGNIPNHRYKLYCLYIQFCWGTRRVGGPNWSSRGWVSCVSFMTNSTNWEANSAIWICLMKP